MRKVYLIFQKIEKASTIILSKILFLDKYYKYFFIVFIISFYFIFKNFFVTGMGGDDGRFYIFYPNEFYEGKVLNSKIYFLGSEFKTEYLINTLFVLSYLEKVGFGYKDFYFLIFFLGFYFFYLSLKEIKKYYDFEGPLSNYFIFFLSLLYPANPLVIDQVWNNHWASIFTIIGTPLVFYVFLKIIFKKINFLEIVFYNLVFTALSLYFINVVHIQVMLIFLFIFSCIYLVFNKKDLKFFISRTLFFLIIFISLNFNWIFNTFFSLTKLTEGASTVIARDLEYYKTVSNFEFIFLGYNKINNVINSDIFFTVSFILFATVVLVSLLVLINKILKDYLVSKNKLDFFTLGILICFSIIGYLQTIALTKIGAEVFIQASKVIHILNGLRNYINKVPPIYSLIVLTIVFISYVVISKKYKFFKLLLISVIMMFSLVSLRELTLLSDFKFNLPEGYKRASYLDKETFEIINYLEDKKDIQRISYFPLSEGPYDLVKNEKTKELYQGFSPIFAFTGIDSINSTSYLEGKTLLSKYFKTKEFTDMSIEEIMFKIKFLGVNKIVFNNEIDLNNFIVWSYPKTNKYSLLKEELEKNYVKDFESSNKRFSVYHIENNLIQFKNSLYKLDENTDFDFYSLDYENSTFTFDTLPKQNLNFYVSNQKNSNHYLNYPIDKFLSKYNQLIEMKVRNASNFPAFNTTDKLYVLNVSGDNLLRIALSSPKNYVSVRAAVDGSGATCLSRLFGNIKECEMFKDIQPEKVNGNYVYTVKFEETAPGNMYILFKNNNPDEFKTEEINPVFYTADVSQLKYNPFSEEERLRYLDKYFVKNELSVEYQIPKTIDSSRVSAGVYKVKVELEDRKLPLILVLKNQYSPNWIVEGSFIEKQSRFNSDGMFNGWVIQPNGKSDTLELTIKLKQNKYEDLIKNLNSNLIVLCVLIVVGYGVYFVVKKYKRLGK